jgi:hypothetical protein
VSPGYRPGNLAIIDNTSNPLRENMAVQKSGSIHASHIITGNLWRGCEGSISQNLRRDENSMGVPLESNKSTQKPVAMVSTCLKGQKTNTGLGKALHLS